MELIGAFAIIIGVLAVTFMIFGIKRVSQGYEYTVERFGRYIRTLSPGLNIIIPVFDGIGARVNMMERVMDVPSQEVITKDNAMVQVNGIIFFQVLDPVRASYEVNNLEHAILNLTMTNIRTVMGSMDLDELLSLRDKINAELLGVVDEATQPWGVKATRIEIKDISPPRDLVDSMARQMKAEREKRADVLEAEGHRQSEVLRAEGQKQAAILEAEGHKQAVILEATARREAAFLDAEAREREAKAEANATRVVSAAIEEGDINAINYFVATRYTEALKDIASAPNSKMIFMPLEASNVIGAIGGITELVKGSMKSDT